MRRVTSTILVLVIAALLVGGVAACGDSSDDDAGGTANLKVGVLPILDVAPLYLGIEKGFFADEDLELEPQLAQGGAEVVPAVLGGSQQFGYAGIYPLMAAQIKELPVKVVTQGAQAAPGYSAVFVQDDGPIKSPEDLVGKTIAVNTLASILQPVTMAALEEQGLTQEQVEGIHFTEVGFPEMLAALDRGDVDAVVENEPFVTIANDQGGFRSLFESNNVAGTQPELTQATYFTSADYADQNPEIVERFTDAMNESLDYAAAHPEEVRAVLPTYTSLTEQQSQDVALPGYRSDLDRASFDFYATQASKYGLLEESPDIDALALDGRFSE